MKTSSISIKPLVLATLAVGLTWLSAAPAHAFFQTGLEVFGVAGGSSTTDVEATIAGMAQDPQSLERDDSSGLGLTLWGTFNFMPYVGAGLGVHYIPTLEFSDEDRTAHEYGSELDLNAMVTASIPVRVVNLTLFLEGGLTTVSLSNEFKTENRLDIFDDNVASPFGWNVGGGAKVGYSLIPLLGLHLGVAYQYYTAPLFEGSRTVDIGDEKSTVDLSGDRIRLEFGVDLHFL